MNAKARLFGEVLERLKQTAPYFSIEAVKKTLNESKIKLANDTLREYMSEAMKKGIVHNAGRGWYSCLKKPITLDPKPVILLVKLLQKQFPLLHFSCWSTQQINPYMHHLLGKFAAFVYTESDAIETVAEFLKSKGYDTYANPTGLEKQRFVLRNKTVVVRSGIPWKSFAPGPYAPLEVLLVDLFLEVKRLTLMDLSEFHVLLRNLTTTGNLNMALMLGYLRDRKQSDDEFFGENQPIISE